MQRVIYFLFGEFEKKKSVEYFLCLSFFPLTFVISNIIQDLYGKRVANSMVGCSFIADIFLVFMALIIATLFYVLISSKIR